MSQRFCAPHILSVPNFSFQTTSILAGAAWMPRRPFPISKTRVPLYQDNQFLSTSTPFKWNGTFLKGGFAHVYLVRTAAPVYNTTHHVLKRIAVANEAMLTDVKKEVDIMRLLKGHPNIVHLIDAAWHRMANGLYEVFILMEFCPGGGIIDMMNRRLRERLTEAEILQIFVDVCEGVAYMHNSRPPLLHRDLKVENILQASPTSFKLCDFGSATTVATKPPSNIQEVRALEEDLNRHTTLQYRAPEMIDPHLRRPIDEKSDVWALGVLLYKLCYYTTPFEEHGPLAILNVQYRIPPYPVYSSQMNTLIASMLREHGTQRPSVFELLAQVHRLRGTKSHFQYNIPPPQPLAPRIQHQQKSPSPNPVQSTISYRQSSSMAVSVNSVNPSTAPSSLPRNAGVEARDKVLEAIAPMRRGRPTVSKESSPRSTSPAKTSEPAKETNWLDDEEKAWQAVTTKSTRSDKPQEDAWAVDHVTSKAGQRGFGDDFGEQPWKSNPNFTAIMKPTISPSPGSKVPLRPPFSHRTSDQPAKPASSTQAKDAFDGLGFSLKDAPAPTLAEARNLRTGLATSATQYSNGKFGSNSPGPKASSSPRPSYPSPSPSAPQSLGLIPPPLQPSTSGSSWSSQPPSRPGSSQPQSPDTLAAESKFPSLEELDASFAPRHDRQRSTNSAKLGSSASQLLNKPPVTTKPSSTGASNLPHPGPSRSDGLRPQQASSTAMRSGANSSNIDSMKATKTPSSAHSISRGHSIRKHRSSLNMKAPPNRDEELLYSPDTPTTLSQTLSQTPPTEVTPRLPPRPSQRDWLTGDDLSEISPAPRLRPVETSQPILRDSPSKRASYIQKSHIPIQEAIAVTPESLPQPHREPESPARRAHRVFPDLDTTAEPTRVEHLTENWSPVNTSAPPTSDTASSADEDGPEDVDRTVPASSDTKKRRKGRQSSVHDLVDLWGKGGAGGAGRVSPDKKRDTQKEMARSTVTPLPKLDNLAKRRSLATPVIPTNARRRSISPKPVPSPSSGRPPGTPSSAKSNVTSPTSSNSSRSRPQSMFLFPSKSTGTPAPLPVGLTLPENPQPRTARRTSISDMVQRYEAIDAVARTGIVAPNPIPYNTPRSVSQKAPTSLPEKTSPPPQASAPVKQDGQIIGEENGHSTPAKSRFITTGIPRPSHNRFPTSSASSDEPSEMVTPRARRISTKKPDSQIAFPTRKPTIPLPDEPAQSGDTRSPSPERPYQGVGKLIDQWQRKTAESEATRTPAPKRGGLVSKRATLVNGGN